MILEHVHGAAARAAPDHTAFAQRDDHYALDILPMWSAHADTERCTAWAREFAAAVQPFSAGVYVNYLGDEGEARVRSAYGSNYERLAALKKKYDPTNFFRMNQNIKPSA